MKTQIVSFHCILRDKIGKILSSTLNHDVITHIEGQGTLLQGLAEELQKLQKGEKKSVFLSADQAYGFYDPNLIMEVSRRELSHGNKLRVGDQIRIRSDSTENTAFRVIQTTSQSVTLDGNHPLAGQDLLFDIEIIETRDATIEEIAETHQKTPAEYYH